MRRKLSRRHDKLTRASACVTHFPTEKRELGLVSAKERFHRKTISAEHISAFCRSAEQAI